MSDTVYGALRGPRGRALMLLCAAQLLVFLDATIVNVALPTIERRLGFSETSLSWVVNAYLLTFGGLLVLAGRAGDLFGRRRIFVAGLVLFTAASLGCALAGSQAALIAGRAIQGVAAAGVSAAGLAMIVALYEDPADRARGLGIFSFVASGGGTLGVLLGGVLVQALGWQSIFAVAVPPAAALLAFVPQTLAPERPPARSGRLDVAGAAVLSATVVLAIVACIGAGSDGWSSATTLASLGGATAALAAFVAIETRTPAPLIPLHVFHSRPLVVANALAALLRAAMFGWFFFSALYMQQVLGLSSLATGLGFLPATVMIGACSYSLTARIVRRAGPRVPFVAGAGLAALGLAADACAPTDGTFLVNVLPGMVLVGTGGGLLFMPLILVATSSAGRGQEGLASGLVSTSQQLGGALGLAVLASLAGSGLAGFHRAFGAAAALAALAAAIGAAWLPGREVSPRRTS